MLILCQCISGIILLGIGFKNWWGLIGLAPILTGATRYCPANTVLGIDNCKKWQN
ncbi:YgaP family membrane protein [Cohnella soli]|uniref:DUF2892 domain-containing protein n=1 Tax=Cohnella soli TaxID=425005 RepID=A0ABW0HZF3_9BACL